MKIVPCINLTQTPAGTVPSRPAEPRTWVSAQCKLLNASLCGALLLTGVAGCSGMSSRGQDTAVGAGAGAVAGAVLTGGSGVGTVGGAVVGGVVGNAVGKK